MTPFEKIYKLVSLVPKGKVLTYKKIAEITGIKDIRVVGFALNKNKDPKKVPCHRVVRSDGKLAEGYVFGGQRMQKKKLIEEGVKFLDGETVDLKECLYKVPAKQMVGLKLNSLFYFLPG
jgi:methylated-DNA-protein-cysteine methyltransferase-like protein